MVSFKRSGSSLILAVVTGAAAVGDAGAAACSPGLKPSAPFSVTNSDQSNAAASVRQKYMCWLISKCADDYGDNFLPNTGTAGSNLPISISGSGPFTATLSSTYTDSCCPGNFSGTSWIKSNCAGVDYSTPPPASPTPPLDHSKGLVCSYGYINGALVSFYQKAAGGPYYKCHTLDLMPDGNFQRNSPDDEAAREECVFKNGNLTCKPITWDISAHANARLLGGYKKFCTPTGAVYTTMAYGTSRNDHTSYLSPDYKQLVILDKTACANYEPAAGSIGEQLEVKGAALKLCQDPGLKKNMMKKCCKALSDVGFKFNAKCILSSIVFF